MYREEVISVLKGIYLSITITYLYIQEIFLFLLFENKAGGLLCNMMKRYELHFIFGKFKYTCSLPLCN